MKSQQDVAAEIQKLRAMQPNVRRTSVFGDNHHHAIDAQVDVLTRCMDVDDVEDVYGEDGAGDEFAQNVYDAAMDANEWLHATAEVKAPSEEWAPLVMGA